MRILMIDDQATNLRLLENILRRHFGSGADLVECSTCEDGLQLLNGDQSFDLVITDFNTQSRKHGIDVAKAAQSCQIPVILCSGYELDKLRAALEAAGVGPECYLEKPYKIKKILVRLEALGFKPVAQPT